MGEKARLRNSINNKPSGAAKPRKGVIMKSLEKVKNSRIEGEYIAIAESGRRFKASFTNNYGGVMFFCIPSDEIIIGYEKVGE